MSLLFLLGLVSAEAQTNRPIRFQCPTGEEFTVTFRGGRNARATLDMTGKPRLTLRQVPAASGAKYSDGYTTLWEKSGEVLIESGSVHVGGCTERGHQMASTMNGMFTYLADAATFTDCATGTRYPVAMEGKYIDAERDYTARRLNGAPLHVTIEGSIEARPPMEGPSPVPTVIISRFVSANPGQQCADDGGSLSGDWVLTELNGNPISVQRPPTMSFQEDGSRVAGFGGCNRFMSTVESSGTKVKFQGGAATRMACPGPEMSLEDEFLKSLETLASYELNGAGLSLMDEGGGVRMKFRRQ